MTDLYFPESGDTLWSASVDGTIRKWSFPDGKLLTESKAPVFERMRFEAISPDGRIAVAIFEDGSSFLWDIETGDHLVKLR